MIGFAAETEHLIDNAKAKFERKGCDWIVANDVSPATGVMGGDRNTVHLLRATARKSVSNSWPVMTKEQVATELVARIAKTFWTKANMSDAGQSRHPAIAARRRAARCRPIRARMPRGSICWPPCPTTRR